MAYPETCSAKVCKALHQDHWDYVKEDEYWCPICNRLRKP